MGEVGTKESPQQAAEITRLKTIHKTNV